MRDTNICRGCGAPVIWVRTSAGKKMPIDAEPVWVKMETGGDTFIRADGSFVFGRKVGDAYEDDDPDSNLIEAHESHFATCPQAGQFRNRQPRRRAPGFR